MLDDSAEFSSTCSVGLELSPHPVINAIMAMIASRLVFKGILLLRAVIEPRSGLIGGLPWIDVNDGQNFSGFTV